MRCPLESHPERAADYARYFGGDARQAPEAWDRASPITWVDGSEPPFLLIHGETDRTVDREQSVSFAAALEGAGADVALELMPVLSHMSIANSTQAFEIMAHFLAALAEQGTVIPCGSEGMIAFYSERDGNAEIYVMDPDGSGLQRLTEKRAGDYWPSWGASATASQPEAAKSGGETALEITYISNEGFLIVTGDDKILIDGLLEAGGGMVSTTTARETRYARPPFDDVDLVLVTHSHVDHFDPLAVGTHLENNLQAAFVSTEDVVSRLQTSYSGFGAFQDRVTSIELGRGESTQLVAGGIDLEIIDVPHSRTPNLGFLITIGGFKLLHLGDPDVDPSTASSLQPYELSSKEIDVLFIPWHFLADRKLHSVITETIQPAHTIPMHYTPRQALATIRRFRDQFPDAVVFEEELQTWTLDGSQ
jgi:L-ascorbate metabolism protein UlaG (beta-lactamase superfamily)